MRRGGWICFIFVMLLMANASLLNAEVSVEVSVRVADAPILSITSPQNGTYLTTDSLLLDYSVVNADTILYNFDNSPNTTITSSIRFDTTEGSHTLYLYAENSEGLTAKNITFFIDSSKFTIMDDEYEIGVGGDSDRKIKKGDSTDFFDYSYEELQSLAGIILDNEIDGKIVFNGEINLTDDGDFSDGILDLETYTNISFNRIELDSVALLNFNEAATLYLHNLPFTNPRILMDGNVCPELICTKESYSEGTLEFSVTGFTIYSAEETPVGTPPSSSGGGGGGSRTSVKSDILVDKETIHVTLKQGEAKQESFVIKNSGDKKTKVKIVNHLLSDYVKTDEQEFYLEKGESKIITFDFIAGEDAIPDMYLGKVLVLVEGVEKEILIAVEIESKKALFDVGVRVPRKFLYVLPGDELLTEVELYNLGEEKRVDVVLEYFIRDFEGNVIVSEEETLAVETRTSFIKTFEIPENIKRGRYLFYTRIIYDEQLASASAWFNVGRNFYWTIRIGLAFAIGFLTLVAIVVYLNRKNREHLKELFHKHKNKKK